MQACDHCGARMPQLPVRIDVVRESGPIAPAGAIASPAFTKSYRFCSSDHAYAWAREGRMMICNRQPTAFHDGMQPLLPSRHMGGRIGLCDGHHTGAHEWKEAFPG
jgi:hypothetical protein